MAFFLDNDLEPLEIKRCKNVYISWPINSSSVKLSLNNNNLKIGMNFSSDTQ